MRRAVMRRAVSRPALARWCSRVVWIGLLGGMVVGAGMAPAQEAPGAAATEDGGALTVEALPGEVELTRAVRQDLGQIREQWRQWKQAFVRNEPERAETLVEAVRLLAGRLGFERLPDLAVAAAQMGLEAARREEVGDEVGGEANPAVWALDHAERLDPKRPEVAFLRAQVHRLSGDRAAALASELEGYRRLWSLQPGRSLAGTVLVVWALQVALLAVAGLILVTLLAHGRRLAADLAALLGRTPLGRLPGWLQSLVMVALLVWPVVLPGGLLWVFLLLSALLLAYASFSVRVVLVVGWIVLALAPALAMEEHRQVELTLTPSLRAVDGMVEGRLYGRLFDDLGHLGTLLPRDPAVIQLMADLHRKLGQWQLARELYQRVIALEPNNAWALMDLGSYYFVNEDYAIARSYFEQATRVEGDGHVEEQVMAYFNLSQAYAHDQSYLFPKAVETLRKAQDLDERLVSRLQRETGQDRIFTFDGGAARRGEIRDRLEALREEARSPLPVARTLATILATLALALLWWWARRKLAGEQRPAQSYGRWVRVVVPGVGSVAAGRGGRALGAILSVVVLATLPWVSSLSLPIHPGAGEPGLLLAIVAAVGLLAVFGVRALVVPAGGEVA